MKRYAILLGTILLGLASALSYAQAPVPFINLPLVPDATPPGGPQFTLTVNGTGFVPTSVVNWNGTALATQFVSQSQLTATVPAANIATAGSGWVTVVTPAPGGGKSNTAFFTATDSTGNSVAFTLASSPVTGTEPWSVAVGDFNGDGKLDLAVANYCGSDPLCESPGTVSILLGDGTGNFSLCSSPAVGLHPQSVAVSDFNGDGKLDLAVANYDSGTISLLLGDGTGNFTLASSAAVGVGPDSVAVGDFNGDGKLDLAVANFWGNVYPGIGTVSILLGDGTGNFTLASSPVVGYGPASVAVGDFNGDGKLDLAVANFDNNTVSILLGDGTGNFTLASSPATGMFPESVVVGDFNGDGRLDLATVNLGASTGSILLQVPPAPAVTLSPTSLTFGTQLVRTSTAQTVTLTNTGSAPLSITAVAASANFGQFNNCGSSLAPGVGCTITVFFRPEGVGTLTGKVTITDNASNSPQTVSLTGVATAVTLLPSSLGFGSQAVGTTSHPQTVTLTNYGAHALTLYGGHFTGNNPVSFAESNNCGASVPAGGSCTISITFTPKGKGTGSATLEVMDDGGASPQTVTLTGTGT